MYKKVRSVLVVLSVFTLLLFILSSCSSRTPGEVHYRDDVQGDATGEEAPSEIQGSTPNETAFLAACEALGVDPDVNRSTHGYTEDPLSGFSPQTSNEELEELLDNIAPVTYREYSDTISLEIGSFTGEILESMKPHLDGQEGHLELDYRYADTEEYLTWDFAGVLQTIDFSSLRLSITYPVYAKSENISLDFLRGITNLNNLHLGSGLDVSALPELPELQTLSVRVDIPLVGESRSTSFSFEGLALHPKLESLTLHNSDKEAVTYRGLTEFQNCKALTSVNFSYADTSGGQVIVSDALVLETARICPAIQTIQNIRVAEFSLEKVVDLAVYEEFLRSNTIRWANQSIDAYATGSLADTGEAPAAQSNLLVVLEGADYDTEGIDEYNSLYSAQAGADYCGIPNSALARSIEDCRYIAVISFERGESVGRYFGAGDSLALGGFAFKTNVMLVIIDTETNTASKKILTGTTEPPEVFEGTLLSNAYGVNDPWPALNYLAGLY